MKKHLFTVIVLFFTVLSATSQSYIGYLTDNYNGIHGAINNPANIADSRLKAEINLVGFSSFVGNDYYGVKLGDLFKSGYDFEDDAKKFAKDRNNILGNVDVLGPSVMFNINRKNSIAVYTRARAFFNVNEISGKVIESLVDGFDNSDVFSVDQGNILASTHSWGEIGITYARTLLDKNQHFLKGGATLKYLQGLGNAYAVGKNINLSYDSLNSAPIGIVTTTGELAYGYSENLKDDLDEIEVVSGATGIGADLGFVYEWRPDYEKYTATDSKGNSYTPQDINKYKLKFGVSLTDLGSISYDKSVEERYDLNNTLDQNTFEDIDDIDDVEIFYTTLDPGNANKAVLPTALHLNADWSINQKFYLNLNTDLSLTKKNKINTSRIANTISLTPRFETKWFSIYSPISIVEHSGFQWGTGLRAGPFYIGSGSILSALISDQTKALDAYAGLKIPIYQSRPKDKDNDGILDKVDECPEIKGPEENYGCPWPDTDGDTVLDKDDQCPEEAGEVENNGCPWLDTDGDTILDKDDNCPQESGAIDNKGCPWPDTDGDSVLDKDDNCPDVAGTVANNGCPEVTEEVQKTLNAYAKTILFDSGKSSIKKESNKVLSDIISILKEYPTAKFVVEGHTDSVGSSKLNQRLSDARSNAVKNYLVENGIDQFRLSAIGYGEDRPIASNKTKAGRVQNRRVEINLVK